MNEEIKKIPERKEVMILELILNVLRRKRGINTSTLQDIAVEIYGELRNKDLIK